MFFATNRCNMRSGESRLRRVTPRLIGFVANRPSPVTERPIRKKREHIVRGIVVNFYDVSSNRNGVRVYKSWANRQRYALPGHRSSRALELRNPFSWLVRASAVRADACAGPPVRSAQLIWINRQASLA